MSRVLGIAAALVAVAAGAVAVALAGSSSPPREDGRPPVPTAQAPGEEVPAAALKADRFDEDRAWQELERQVQAGPRPAGSQALRALAPTLRDQLPRARFERVPGHPRLRNIAGRIPGTKPAIVIAAHYDTKDLPGFVGANDGAAGTAAVIELARAFESTRRGPAAPELRFVLFDGEEATDDRRPFAATGLRGSTAYARRHRDEVGAVVLLDFVAAKGMRIRREANSDAALWERLRSAARRVGAQRAFPSGTGTAIEDDHVPFLLRDIPAIDLIQWPYQCWHKPCDDLSAVDRTALDQTGETVFELVRTLRPR